MHAPAPHALHHPRVHRGSSLHAGKQLVATVRQTPECFGLPRMRWRLGIRLKWARLRLHSADPAYATRLAWIVRATQQARAHPA